LARYNGSRFLETTEMDPETTIVDAANERLALDALAAEALTTDDEATDAIVVLVTRTGTRVGYGARPTQLSNAPDAVQRILKALASAGETLTS
jgi:hypothetical protein